MSLSNFSILTVCGIDEIAAFGASPVSHVLSVVDPELPELQAFQGFAPHSRTTIRFHDIIDPQTNKIMPTRRHMEEILAFGDAMKTADRTDGHLLVHCHMGVSRSTAAMVSLMAQAAPATAADDLFARLRAIRPQAWPNSVLIGFADDILGRNGELTEGLHRHYAHQKHVRPDLADWMVELGRKHEVELANAPSP